MADINLYDCNMHEGMNVLHRAVLQREYGLVAWLLDHEVDVNTQAFNGDTAMHFAAQMEDLVMMKLLALSGANVNLMNAAGQDPISFLSYEIYIDVLQDLYIQRANLEKAFPIENEAPNGHGLCHLAVQYGYIDVIQKLIEKEYMIDTVNNHQETPLHVAVREGNLQIIDLLIKAGAKLDSKDIYAQTPLHHAAQYNNLVVVKFLCQRGADLHAEDSNGATLVHIAAQYGALDILKWAHQVQNLDMNCLDDDGDVPLHYAARNGELKIIDYLLNIKSNINVINFDNETPLYVAVAEKHMNVLEYLYEKKVLDLNSPIYDDNYLFHIAVYDEYIPLIKWLIHEGANINVQNSEGNTPLHLAIISRNLDIISLLKDNGADVNIKNEYNETALMCALNNEVDASLFCTPEAELDLSETEIYDYLIKNIGYVLSRNKLPEKILVGINILKAFEALKRNHDANYFTGNLIKNLVQIIEDGIANVLKSYAINDSSNMLEHKIQIQELKETLKQALNSEIKSIVLRDALYEGMLAIGGIFCLANLPEIRAKKLDDWGKLGDSRVSWCSNKNLLEDSDVNRPHKIPKYWHKHTDSMHMFEEKSGDFTILRGDSDTDLYLMLGESGKIDAEL